MKTIILLVMFSWSCNSIAIQHQSIKPFGYWPITDSTQYHAVIPMIKKSIKSEDTSGEIVMPAYDAHAELLMATVAATVALTPHFMLGYHF